MKNRSEKEKQLRDEQAASYEEWYLQRGLYNTLIEDLSIIEVLKPSKKDIILDAGCGTGRLIQQIAPFCKKAYGVDISPASIEILNNKNISNLEAKTFDFAYDDIKQLNIEQVDKILSVQMLQHIEPEKFTSTLQKLHSLLKKNGFICLELYNFAGLHRIQERKKNKNIKKFQENENFFEYRFEPLEMEELLLAAGFKNIKSFGVCNFSRNIVSKIKYNILPIEFLVQKTFFSKYLGYYFISIAYKI